MKKFSIILLFIFGFFATSNSQVVSDSKAIAGSNTVSNKQENKEVAFNMTSLTKRLMPFNVSSVGLQNYSMQFRKQSQYSKFYFVSAFGFNMGTDADENEIMHFDLRTGFEKRKNFANKWYYGSSYNILLFIHEIEEDALFGDEVDGGAMFDKSFLLGYHINDHISVFTEASLQFGLSTNTLFKLEFQTPGSIYFNVKF